MQFNPTQLHTLVIKIGTALLGGGQSFDGHVMESVVREVCRLKHEHDLNILLVSSGAVGQAILMHYYQALFRTHGEGLHAAQVLLNLADLDDRQSGEIEAILGRKDFDEVVHRDNLVLL